MSDNELTSVWRGSETIGWPFGSIVQLLILTGQRRGEIAGMRWQEIDLDAKTWTLPKERSKNGAAHVVPLSEPALSILKGLPRVASNSGFVFTVTGEAAVSGFAAAVQRINAALPPDMPEWTIHDLRRTFASGCARLGIDLHVVEKCLNHVSGSLPESLESISAMTSAAKSARRWTAGVAILRHWRAASRTGRSSNW